MTTEIERVDTQVVKFARETSNVQGSNSSSEQSSQQAERITEDTVTITGQQASRDEIRNSEREISENEKGLNKISIQIGNAEESDNRSENIVISLGRTSAATLGGVSAANLGVESLDVEKYAQRMKKATARLDEALGIINTYRENYGKETESQKESTLPEVRDSQSAANPFTKDREAKSET